MISDYFRGLRAKVGHDLLILPSVTVLLFDDERRVLLVRHSNEGLWVVGLPTARWLPLVLRAVHEPM
jgi:hypothetical protein